MAQDVMMVEDVEVDGSNPKGGIISVWTLNRPDKLNALNTESHKAIKKECARVNSDDNVRCVVIKGAPPLEPREGKRPKPHAFAAGADISEFVGKDSDDVRPFFEDNAWEAVWNVSKPTIAMVDGFALGGGDGTGVIMRYQTRFREINIRSARDQPWTHSGRRGDSEAVQTSRIREGYGDRSLRRHGGRRGRAKYGNSQQDCT